MSKEKRLVPEIRFPEFDGEWKRVLLKDIFTIKKGVSLSKADLVDVGEPCVLYGELYTIYKEQVYNVVSRTNVVVPNDKRLQKYDILIPSSGETPEDIARSSCVHVDNVIAGGDLNVLRGIKEIHPSFYSYYISGKHKKGISRLSQGKTVVHLYPSALYSLELGRPEKKEQQKIATFLSLIDKKIELLEKKVELLEEAKRGLLQQIFSQEVRFKKDDGSSFEEWVSTSFNRIMDINNVRNRDSSNTNVLSVSNKLGFISQLDMFNKKNVASDNISNYIIVKRDYFAFNPARINVGSIARLKKYNSGIISPMYTCFKLKENTIDSFFEQYLLTDFFYRQLNQSLVGSVRQVLQTDSLLGFKIKLPLLNEQLKIADFLDKHDSMIDNAKNKLDKMNELKKGLLQKMFI